MDSEQGGGHGGFVQPEDNDATVSRLAQQDKVPWYNKPNLRLLYLLMVPTCLGVEMSTGFDSSMVNGLQAVPSWLEYFHNPRSASLGLMISMYSLGSVAAVPFAPIAVDKIGRRYPVLFGGVISVIGASLQASALNFTTFVLTRFILGFVNSFCIVAGASLIGELSHPKERAIMGSLFGASYYIGAIAAAAVTLGTFEMTSNLGWRIPSALQAVPSLLQASFIWFIPESPRWLVSRGRENEAYDVLVKYHAEGDEDSEFVKAEYAQIEQMLAAGRVIAQVDQKNVFATIGMRKRIIITAFLGLLMNWSGSALISHFLPPLLDSIGIHDNRTKNIINLSRVSWSFVNSTIGSLIAPRYPRRRMYLVCTICLFVAVVAWTTATAEYSLTHKKIYAQVVLVLIFLYLPAYSLIVSLNFAFVVELFPFHVRAQGVALFYCWNHGAAFVAEFINPIGMDAAGWRWYLVYCVWNAFQVVFVYLMIPETSGRTLEELTFLYDEDREAFRYREADTLREHAEDIGTYGTIRYQRST